MIIRETDKSKIEFDSRIQSVIWSCKTEYLDTEEFTQSFEKGMEFYLHKIKEVPNIGWLNDASKIKGANPNDILWLDKNVNDKAYKAGGKKVAFVLPKDIFGRLSIRTYTFMTLKRADNSLQIRSFNKIEEAKDWLSQP